LRCSSVHASPIKTRHGLRRSCVTFLDASEPVPITEIIAMCRDREDDKFLELAVNGRTDLIISGDADLLSLHTVRGIPIVTPAAFVRTGMR
jgi:predicted nucleic acid-binding protein